MKHLLAAISIAMLAGCGITAPQDAGNAYKFTLSPVQPETVARPRLGNLVLDFPKINPQLDTFRIALLRDGGKRDYFAGSRWADFLPQVTQSTMVESLQNSGHFRAVTTDYANFSADYELQGDIKRFDADYTLSNPPTIRIKVHFNLVALQTSRAIKSFVVEEEVQADANDLTSIYYAFNDGFTAAQQSAIKQLTRALRRYRR